MSVKERIFHSLLYEVIALALLVPFGSLISDVDLSHIVWIAVALSLTAMLWNYFYNQFFDWMCGSDRLNRKLRQRIAHSIGFELGMLVAVIPVIMWALELSFITALLLDLGFIVFYLFFTIAFNWCYDLIKHKFFSV